MSKDRRKKLDNFINSLTNTGNGKRESTLFQYGAVLDSETASALYSGDWLARKIVELPVQDAFSTEIEFSSDDDGKDVFHEEIDRLNVMDKVKEAEILARIYGGSAIIIGADESNATDPESELIYENVEGIKTLNVVGGKELAPRVWNSDVFSLEYGMPETWTYTPYPGGGASPGEPRTIHNSRVLLFKGDYIPKGSVTANTLGWPYGQSILQTAYEAIRDYSIIDDCAVEIAQSYGIKVLSLSGLMDLLKEDDNDDILEARAQLVNSYLSAHRTLIIDTDEDLNFRNPQITGFDKLLDHGKEQVSAVSYIPRQRLFSQQLGTLAGAGETTKSYYDLLQKIQYEAKDNLDIIFNMIAAGAGLEEFSWSFSDFTKPDEKTIVETRKIQAETDQIYILNGVLTAEEIETSRFSDGYSIETTLMEGEAGNASLNFEIEEETEEIEEVE